MSKERKIVTKGGENLIISLHNEFESGLNLVGEIEELRPAPIRERVLPTKKKERIGVVFLPE